MEKDRVFFHKPNHDLFHSLGLKSVDMHFHSRYSDCFTRVRTIIKKAKKLNIGVSITDHNEIQGSLRACENKDDVMVIPGIEVSTMQGPHLLFYFYNPGELAEFHEKHVEPFQNKNPFMAIHRNVQEILDASRDYNCIRGAAHPYGYMVVNSGLSKLVQKKHISEYIFDKIDTMEVICGAMNRRLNRKAIETAKELSKCFTGGTDGHTIFQLGKVVASSYAEDVETFLNNILKKKNYVIGKETSMRERILPNTNMVTKHMKYAVPSIKLQYEINKTRVTDKLKTKKAALKNRIQNLTNGKK